MLITGCLPVPLPLHAVVGCTNHARLALTPAAAPGHGAGAKSDVQTSETAVLTATEWLEKVQVFGPAP